MSLESKIKYKFKLRHLLYGIIFLILFIPGFANWCRYKVESILWINKGEVYIDSFSIDYVNNHLDIDNYDETKIDSDTYYKDIDKWYFTVENYDVFDRLESENLDYSDDSLLVKEIKENASYDVYLENNDPIEVQVKPGEIIDSVIIESTVYNNYKNLSVIVNNQFVDTYSTYKSENRYPWEDPYYWKTFNFRIDNIMINKEYNIILIHDKTIEKLNIIFKRQRNVTL